MALPSGDTFITNVLIDLPWLFIFQSHMKPLIWQVHDAGDTAEILDTDISHCLTSAHMCIFPSVLPCKHPSQPTWQKRMTWNSVTKFISKKKETWLAFSEENSKGSQNYGLITTSSYLGAHH